MIVKGFQMLLRKNPRGEAGIQAERDMAHYLQRRFRSDPEVLVLHGLRLEDADEPEPDGAPGACQIDHLLVHRWGMFLVECKSVSVEVRVRPDGSGGDEWSRLFRGKERGMPSPIQQAKRQAAFLRAYLERHAGELLKRVPPPAMARFRAARGSDRRGFAVMPIQLIVSVSDSGLITRLDGWEPPQKPLPVFVCKADLVTDKIAGELKRYEKAPRFGKQSMWRMANPSRTNKPPAQQ